MAEDREEQGKVRSRAPLSAHPAFPPIVGLWFAALLGLGTVVMPAVVLEQFASTIGLASVFPQTEAPLTATARAAFALLATVIGLVGGLILARRVAESQQYANHAPRRRAPRAADRAVRPLSVNEDLGADAIGSNTDNQPAPIPGRRRALAVIEEERPSDFLLAAPLPGHEETATPDLPIDEEPMTERPSEFDAELPIEAEAELDLSQLVADSPIYDPPTDEQPAEAQVFHAPVEAVVDVVEPPAVPAYVPELDTRKPRDPVVPAAVEVTFETAPEAAPPLAAAPIVEAPLDASLGDLGMIQLAERLGRSLQQRLAAATLDPEAGIEPQSEPLAFSAPSLEQEPEASDEGIAVPPPVVPDALRAFMDDELEEAPVEAAPVETAEVEVAQDADETELQVPVPVVPEALRPFAFEPFDADEDDDGDDQASFTLPLADLMPRPFDAPTLAAPAEIEPVRAEASDEQDEADVDALAEADESYSSLLEMNNPFRQREEFVRVDEPEAEDEDIEPAVVFPSQEATPLGEAAPPADSARPFDAPHQPAPSTAPVRPRAVTDPSETDRALRAALANLQRMSGAA